jgi:hypothetical protein
VTPQDPLHTHIQPTHPTTSPEAAK